ncbi:hypothetical protein VTO58DRAFT_104386 [Aureobasidium pullulans]
MEPIGGSRRIGNRRVFAGLCFGLLHLVPRHGLTLLSWNRLLVERPVFLTFKPDENKQKQEPQQTQDQSATTKKSSQRKKERLDPLSASPSLETAIVVTSS